jgi:hypothetical protein
MEMSQQDGEEAARLRGVSIWRGGNMMERRQHTKRRQHTDRRQ